MSDNIEKIPVDDYEKYSINVDKIRGIEVEFSDERITLGDICSSTT
jgi:hypothetical protein